MRGIEPANRSVSRNMSAIHLGFGTARPVITRPINHLPALLFSLSAEPPSHQKVGTPAAASASSAAAGVPLFPSAVSATPIAAVSAGPPPPLPAEGSALTPSAASAADAVAVAEATTGTGGGAMRVGPGGRGGGGTAGAGATAAAASRHGLFHDESMASFYRRLSWSPDGAFMRGQVQLHERRCL